MTDPRLLSRCGIYCGACYVYRAERDGGALLDELSKKLSVSREKIRCSGCSGPYDEQWPNCQDCFYKQCQRNKGVWNCAQCSEFDACTDYEGGVKFTTYRGEEMRKGILRIEAGEGEEWLLEQGQRWSCHKCGHPLMWYDNNCRGCGAKVKDAAVTWKPAPLKG